MSDPRLTVLTWNMDEGVRDKHISIKSAFEIADVIFLQDIRLRTKTISHLTLLIGDWPIASSIIKFSSKEKVTKRRRDHLYVSATNITSPSSFHPARKFSPRPIPLTAEPLRLASSFGANHM
jgi:hypothetical protein